MNMIIKEKIEQALLEDIGTGDITTDYLDLGHKNVNAFIIAKEDGILCGIDIAKEVFRMIDPEIHLVAYKKDGDKVVKGDDVLKISGMSKSILKAERVALNFMQRLSGISTMTGKYVDEIKETEAKLLDTRKTTPLLRYFEKYAVRTGGGYNHRFGLYDMVMIKENHIRSVGTITDSIRTIKNKNSTYKIEVEVTNLDELEESVLAGADRILLDNMSLEDMSQAVEQYGKRVELEASGNITLETIKDVAETGVHFISSGALTHSYKSLDLSLLVKE